MDSVNKDKAIIDKRTYVDNTLIRLEYQSNLERVKIKNANKVARELGNVKYQQEDLAHHIQESQNINTPIIYRRTSSSDEDTQFAKNSYLFVATRKKNMQKMSEVLNDGADINAKNGNGQTILHIAIKKNYKDVVAFLLRYKDIKFNIPNKDGDTALDLAKYPNRQDIFQMLKNYNKQVTGIPEDMIQKKTNLDDAQESSCIAQNVQQGSGKQSSIQLQKRKSSYHSDVESNSKRVRLYVENDELTKRLETDSIDLNKEAYHKGGLVHSLHGNIYQLKLQMLFLKRALDKRYEFNLGTEVEDAEKFDDIVFKYKTRGEIGKNEIRFVQAKHKQDESKRITAQDLLTDKDDDFSLQKYFISYSKIKKKHEFNKGELKDFILYTNIKFDSDDLQKEEIKIEEIEENDDILITKSGNSALRYKFIIQKEHKLYEKLRETSDLYLLAKKLAQHISDGKPLQLGTDIFKLYHVPLCETVFQIQKTKFKNKEEKGVPKKYVKFRDNFLNGNNLTKDVSNFRNILQLTLKKENDDAFQQELNGKELGVSLNFGEALKLETDPIISEPEKLAEKIVEIINDAKENTIIFTRQSSVIKNNIDKLAGHILVQNQADASLLRFRKKFCDDNNILPGNLKKFRDALKKAFEKIGIDFSVLHRYNYKISNFKTCEETSEGKLLYFKSTLPNDKITDEEIKEFFEKLVFAVGQPNEVDLGEIISKEIGEDSQFNLLNTDLVVDSFQRKMLDWFKEKRPEKGKEGVWLNDESGKKFFDSLERQVNSLMSVGLSLAYSEKLQAYDIRFDIKNLFNKLKTFLTRKSKIFHIIAPEKTILSAINVYSILTKLKNQKGFAQYNQDDSYIFLRLSTLLRPKTKKRVMDAFKSKDSHNLLIIDCKSSVLQNQIQEVEKLCNNLDEVISSNENKKVIFISTKSNNAFTKKFATDSNKYESEVDSSGFNNLTKESQQKLLERVIILQGEKIRLNTLIDMPNENPKKIIDVKTLVQLITNEEINIDRKPPGTSDLEGAYSELFEEVEMNTFVDKLFLDESSDIYVISGIPGSYKEDKLIQSLNVNIEESKVYDLKKRIGILNQQDLPIAVNKRIQVTDEQFKEKDFKQICHNNSDRKIYWIILKNAGDKFTFSLAQIYNPDFYLEGQRFNNEVVIEKNVKEELGSSTLSETFIIGVKDKSEAIIWFEFPNDLKQRQFEENCENNKIQFITVQNNLEVVFQKLIEQNKAQTFHLLKFVRGQLIWCKTRGSLENLRKYRARYPRHIKSLIGEDDLIKEIKDKDKKIVIIAGDPGMGKSTTLVKLYELQSGIKESIIKSHWVIKINLKDHLEIIRNIDFGSSNLETETANKITQFLSKFYKSLNDDFSRNLLGMALVKEHFIKPLLIAFDAFDEVLDEGDRDKIISLLTHLKNRTKAKFWITTRLHYEKTLEDALSTFAIRLDPMDDLTTKKFIKKYLSNRLSIILSQNEFKEIFDNSDEVTENCRLQEYTQAFVSKMREIFKGDVSKFIGTPLQLYLMLESSTRYFKEWVKDSNVQTQDFSYFGNDIWEIYQNFIDRKCRTYFKKADVTVELRQKQDKATFDGYHKDLAKSLILKSAQKESLEEFKDIVLSVGIVRSDGSNTDFIHPTFREYFAAKLLIHWMGKWTEKNQYALTNLKKQEYLLKMILLKPDYQVIRAFLNAKLLKEKIVNIQLQEKSNKDLLFKAAQENNVGIASFVLDNFKDANVNVTSKDGSTLLHLAAKSGNCNMVQYLVAKGANINIIDNHDNTVLHSAAQSGRLDVMQFLVNKENDNINATNKDGNTVLHWAAKSGNSDIVQFLVARGANVDTIDNHGNTVLHSAAESGRLEMVQFLVNKENTNIKAMDNFGHTVLHWAAKSGNYDMVQFLVAKGANVNAIDKYDNTVLHWSAKSGNYDMVQFLVAKGANVNAIDNYGNTILHSSADIGNLDMVQLLVAKGVDVNAANKSGETVLHRAAESGNWDIVKFLVIKGANVNAINQYNKAVLRMAAESNNLEMVEFLVTKGASVHAIDRNGNSILHGAVEFGNWDIVKFLVTKGANVDDTTENGINVLHLAIKSDILEIVKLLISKGANVNATDKSGNTFLHWAVLHRSWNIVPFLVTKGANVDAKNKDGDTILHWAVEFGTLDIVELLIAQSVNIDGTNKYGNTILHQAARYGNLDMVQFLMAKKAKVNITNNHGKTVLHMAAISGNVNVVKFLVVKGAHVDAIDDDGNPVLHLVVEFGNLAMLEFLVAQGANIDATDKDGNTVLHLAAESDNLDMVQFLIVKGAKVDTTNNNGNTVLQMVPIFGNLDVANLLRAKGPKANG
ncbi:hypothetical protein ABEB36_012680 [Hypothenemus hampei]|uniref:Nephrocystin 3-like N-terminal domain-containing protein n=1 Tax=Hypothenemus hampei TaxID=57062 RepID=A0ABD1EE44_HYPHA